MTSPQNDPASDVGAALARLAEQTTGLQRQLTRMEAVFVEQNHVAADWVRDAEARVTSLTEAKFVTFRAMLISEAEKVALALEATEKAIGKAEVATAKAIEKETEANANRFAAVNEFRQQLNDQARTFMPRTEALQLTDQATQRLRELAEAIPQLATRQEVLLMTNRYSERVGELTDRLNRAEGQDRGARDNRAAMIALVSLAVAVVIGAVALFNFLSAQ